MQIIQLYIYRDWLSNDVCISLWLAIHFQVHALRMAITIEFPNIIGILRNGYFNVNQFYLVCVAQWCSMHGQISPAMIIVWATNTEKWPGFERR